MKNNKSFRQFSSATIFILVTALLTLRPQTAHAEGSGISWSEVRFYGSSGRFSTAPDALNNLTSSDQVPSLSSLPGFGFEADVQWAGWIKFGIRYGGVWTELAPPNARSPLPALLSVQQGTFGAIIRVPLIETDFFRLDTFAEGGLANTHIDVETTTVGQGTFAKEGSFYQRVGASAGIGWKSFFFFVEGAQQWNKLENVSLKGTLSSNISSIDLSGMYYGAGIVITGMPSWIKPGSVSIGR